MEINWFIFTAQIINFLILVAVLQRFLYRPIIRAMDRREQTIRDRLETAERSRQEAQQEAERYQRLQQEFADQRATLLEGAKTEVEQTRKALLQTAHQELETTQARWQTAVQHQKDAFLRELRHRAVQQIEQTIRRILTDLANGSLEQQVITTFLQRLETLGDADRQLLQDLAIVNGHALVIHSAFEIPDRSRQALLATLQTILSTDVHLQFEVTPELICGIELRTLGSKLAWSFDHYLDALEENLSVVFDEETGG